MTHLAGSNRDERSLRHFRPISRLLLEVDGRPCSFGCSYCFANFSQYERPLWLSELEANLSLAEDIDVIYPACDSDLFARPDAISVLRRVASLGKSISISTKASLSREHAKQVADIASTLSQAGHVLKVGISVSTNSSIQQIEPRTPSYIARLKTVERLRTEGVVTALVLRPLLADVPDEEYLDIIRDFEPFVDSVLLGDEWLDKSKTNPRRGLDDLAVPEAIVRSRIVAWAQGGPIWEERLTLGRIEGLTAAVQSLGMTPYTSDLDLMADLLSSKANERA